MVEDDPQATRQAAVVDVAAELAAVGFVDGVSIGHGGFGVVFRCEQPALDRTVAVKVMTDHLEPSSVERFVREQRAMGRLSGHPNIVNILEVGTTPAGMPFIVMPFHRNDSLDAQVRKDGPLTAAAVLRIGVKIAGAVETAHRTSTLHRDIKPANILLSEYGEPELCDFGIARIAGGFETGSDIVTGSPAFLAPELLIGAEPSVASDIYGLGATLFCALTGHAAFERRSGEKVVAHFVRVANQQLSDLRAADFPQPVAVAIERAMARDPADRYASASEFGVALQAAQRELGLSVDEMAVPSGAGPTERGAPVPSVDVPTGAMPGSTSDTGLAVVVPTRPRSITAPPTPATRFRPPVRARGQVSRARLFETLRSGERRRLVAIHAPAGYGKTTLAAQWAEELTAMGVEVAWLSVDEDDNNSVWLLTHLVQAIAQVNAGVAADLSALLDEHGENAEQYVLTTLINDIHDRHRMLAVVIDDWHRVTAPDAQGIVEFLLEHGCHHLQIIVTSRSSAGLPMSRMRVRDELVEIDISGLCFDASEAEAFVAGTSGVELQTTDILDLRDSTDGWVAGLQLACVSLRGADSPSELISHISGRHQAIGEFLAENVLGSLEPDIVHFLLTTAVPDRVCASLATALSGLPKGQALLEEVETRDLFLRRIDADGDWFRYHPLFAEFLRRRLDRDDAELVIPLHRKAAEWFADHQMPAQAVHHAIAAGDVERAVDLVEDFGEALVEHSQMSALLAIVDKLPRAAIAMRPRILLLLVWSTVLVGRTKAAHDALGRLDTALDTGGDADIRAIANVVRAVVDAIADRTDRIDELVAECLSRPGDFAPFYVSAAANLAAISATGRFDFAAAHRWQEWAEPYHRENIGQYAVMYGRAMDGLAWLEQLDLDRAEQRFVDALAVSRRGLPGQSQMARLASALLAELFYERGQFEESAALLTESFALAPEEGIADMIIARYVVGARLAAMGQDAGEAARYLDAAAAIGSRHVTPRLRAVVECEQVILGLPTARAVTARVTAQTRGAPAVGLAEVVRQYDEEVAIRLLLDASDYDDATTAVDWAAEWVEQLSGTERARAALRAQRLLAYALEMAGRDGEARVATVGMLATCESAGLVRFPVDGGEALATLVFQICTEIAAGRATDVAGVVSPEYARRVLLSSPGGRSEAGAD